MTRDELESKVKETLKTHLAAAEWNALSEQRKTAAVSMAITDIVSRVRGLVLPAPNYVAQLLVAAVAEQAVFLGLDYTPRTGSGSASSIVASESVDGASISYLSTSDPEDAFVSLRASMYAKSLERLMRCMVRVSRG